MIVALFGLCSALVDYFEPLDFSDDEMSVESHKVVGARHDQPTYIYPKLAHVYNVDIQTKFILLGIMILLFALVFTTTTKMLQEVLKIKVKSEVDDTTNKV